MSRRNAFFYDEAANTLVHVRSMDVEHWLNDHPTFNEVTSDKAGEITVINDFLWTYHQYYYGGDPVYNGASIATAVNDGTYSLLPA
jgi:hypothetical protein